MHCRPSTPQNESGGLGQHVVVKSSCQWHGASNRQRIILEVLVLAFGVCSGVTQAATKQHKGNFRMVDGAQCWRGDTMVIIRMVDAGKDKKPPLQRICFG